MDVRVYFEEGVSGPSLLDSYFNGIYEKGPINRVLHRGIIDCSHFMVNAVDWLYTRIMLDDEILDLDLGEVHFSDFERILDLRNGILHRRFRWETRSVKKLKLFF